MAIKNQLQMMVCVVLAGLVSGGVLGCGVTSEVTSTQPNPNATTSTAIGPAPAAVAADYAPEDGRPGARRPGPDSLLGARVVARRPAGAPLAATRRSASTAAAKAEAEAKAIAIGSPTRRIQSGRILDEAGQPLVGATVLLKGTTRGTSTDASGDYSLPVPLGTNTFVFAYSGYEQEIAQSRDGQPLVITLLPAADRPPAPTAHSTKLRIHKKH